MFLLGGAVSVQDHSNYNVSGTIFAENKADSDVYNADLDCPPGKNDISRLDPNFFISQYIRHHGYFSLFQQWLFMKMMVEQWHLKLIVMPFSPIVLLPETLQVMLGEPYMLGEDVM